MTRMHNPPHSGEVLREYLGAITVTDAAEKLGVNRVTLSSVVTGSLGVYADMAYRLGDAFGTSPEFWAGMQLQSTCTWQERSSGPRSSDSLFRWIVNLQ